MIFSLIQYTVKLSFIVVIPIYIYTNIYMLHAFVRLIKYLNDCWGSTYLNSFRITYVKWHFRPPVPAEHDLHRLRSWTVDDWKQHQRLFHLPFARKWSPSSIPDLSSQTLYETPHENPADTCDTTSQFLDRLTRYKNMLNKIKNCNKTIIEMLKNTIGLTVWDNNDRERVGAGSRWDRGLKKLRWRMAEP